jgi:hypothetical protein
VGEILLERLRQLSEANPPDVLEAGVIETTEGTPA